MWKPPKRRNIGITGSVDSVDFRPPSVEHNVSELKYARDNTRVKTLCLSWVHGEADEDLINDIVDLINKKDREWRSLNLSNCRVISPQILKSFIRVFETVTIDRIEPNDWNMHWHTLGSSLEGVGIGGDAAIQELNLHCDINRVVTKQNVESFHHTLRQNNTLATLTIANCHFEEPDCLEILALKLAYSCKALTNVSFIDCELDDQSMQKFLMGMKLSKSLKELRMGTNCCRSKGLVALSQILISKNCRLAHLSLNNQFPFRDHPGRLEIEVIAPYLLENTTLIELNLRDNRITDEDVEQSLSHIVQNHKSIKIIDLGNNRITDYGATILADQLAHTASISPLRRLVLDGNEITAEGWRSFLPALKNNSGLIELTRWYDAKQSSLSWYAEWQSFLDCNLGGRRILKETHCLPLGLWPVILARINKIHYFPCSSIRRMGNRDRAINVMFSILKESGALLQT